MLLRLRLREVNGASFRSIVTMRRTPLTMPSYCSWDPTVRLRAKSRAARARCTSRTSSVGGRTNPLRSDESKREGFLEGSAAERWVPVAQDPAYEADQMP